VRALEDAVQIVDDVSFPLDVNDRQQMLNIVNSCIGTKFTMRFGSLIAASAQSLPAGPLSRLLLRLLTGWPAVHDLAVVFCTEILPVLMPVRLCFHDGKQNVELIKVHAASAA
jgi:hypothetical protein